ncbi:MAG: guanylate kinase [Deltaproteobacteria bacterium]|jgi:guanylate kinase|nr:guanylate kinase [Deltaproteobacteria bacterium]
MERGNLFIISAPSGAGKTTILKRVLAAMERVVFSVSHTTRPPRPGEQNGVDYHFVDRETFKAMAQQGTFLEWAEVHGNLYGTSSRVVADVTGEGQDIILDIDIQGARQVKERQGVKGIFVFIAPPSLRVLQERLAGRATETAASIATRLSNAREEMQSIGNYDYVIVNDTLERAVEVLQSIIIAERSRNRRGLAGEPLRLVF